jgi:hypothetical protein
MYLVGAILLAVNLVLTARDAARSPELTHAA